MYVWNIAGWEANNVNPDQTLRRLIWVYIVSQAYLSQYLGLIRYHKYKWLFYLLLLLKITLYPLKMYSVQNSAWCWTTLPYYHDYLCQWINYLESIYCFASHFCKLWDFRCKYHNNLSIGSERPEQTVSTQTRHFKMHQTQTRHFKMHQTQTSSEYHLKGYTYPAFFKPIKR